MISIVVAVVAVFLLFHSTSNIALRTHVFFLGYPKAAITSGIIEDEFHNKIDKQKFVGLKGKAYTLTNPPNEKATQGELSNFFVRKAGFLYFAKYYGEA